MAVVAMRFAPVHDARPMAARAKQSSPAREQILLGGAAAFGKHGYARTSVQHILDASGISRRTFYRFFKDRQAVFDEVFERGIRTVLSQIREAMEGAGTPAGKLEAGIDAYLGVHRTLGPVARVLLTEHFPPGSLAERRREEAVEGFIRLIEEEYRGVRRKKLDPLLVRGLVAGMDQVAVAIASEGKPEAWDLDRARRVMLRMLVGALAEEGDPIPPLPLLGR